MDTQQTFSLTKDDTLALKGLAMAAIVAHNFLHQIRPVPLENEFGFHSAEGMWTALAICVKHPLELLHVLLSFFGHYGVIFFVFLSGYGLTKKLLSSSLTGERASDFEVLKTAFKAS